VLNFYYCYFDKKQTDWNRAKERYAGRIGSNTTREPFVELLEMALHELYDNHASLNAHTGRFPRLVPSSSDLWAEFEGGRPVIVEVRRSYGAEQCGIRAGMEVAAIDDLPVPEAIAPFLGSALTRFDREAENYALNRALAGRKGVPRKFTLRSKGFKRDYYPDSRGCLLDAPASDRRIENRITGAEGYIRINNSLIDNALIPEFDEVLKSMAGTRSLILDLRETPSGGNTTVARAILGWFVQKDEYYQKHELTAQERSTGIKRSWMEIVSPREGRFYDRPVVILVDHWTGSVGEGIAIAFDGMKRATVIGTRMAALNGAVYTFEMPSTGIRFSIPVERLFHVNGTPRELYVTKREIGPLKLSAPDEKDVILQEALDFLRP